MNTHRLIRLTAVVTLALVMFGVTHPALAQSSTRVTPCSATTANNEICVTWSAVTGGTNGETLTGITYRVTQKFGSAAATTVQSASTLTQYYAKALAPGNYTFVVYANCTNVGCVESFPSNAASKDATAIPIQPNAPVIVIAATINANGPPTYKIIQSYNPKPNEFVFVVPASQKPLFASR